MSKRCSCGAFMTELDDYAAEGYVEGSYFVCLNQRHAKVQVPMYPPLDHPAWKAFES